MTGPAFNSVAWFEFGTDQPEKVASACSPYPPRKPDHGPPATPAGCPFRERAAP
jgi:hypothetical protein